jgi:serine protease Do
MDVTSVAKAALPAMVQLTGTTTVTSSTFFGYGQSYEASTSGTGIIVGKNDTELLILTNAHVVESVNNLTCTFTDDESVDATVKGSKSDKDVAVVAVSLSEIKSSTLGSIAIAELGESDDVVVGQEVVAIGNALGEGQSVTNGIISALDRSITVDNTTFEGLFMTNAAINSGNSGGALLNADGKVIGINFAKTSEDGVEGMAYSIPISNVRELIDNLMNRQTRTKVATSEQSYLGISAIDITSTMASYYGYPEGVQIRTVEEGSAAEAAGLGKYDIIVSFDDQTISSMSGLQTLMQYYKAGETVTIEYYHIEGNQYILKSVDVTLGSKK